VHINVPQSTFQSPTSTEHDKFNVNHQTLWCLQLFMVGCLFEIKFLKFVNNNYNGHFKKKSTIYTFCSSILFHNNQCLLFSHIAWSHNTTYIIWNRRVIMTIESRSIISLLLYWIIFIVGFRSYNQNYSFRFIIINYHINLSQFCPKQLSLLISNATLIAYYFLFNEIPLVFYFYAKIQH
jgi:hypothetical protein